MEPTPWPVKRTLGGGSGRQEASSLNNSSGRPSEPLPRAEVFFDAAVRFLDFQVSTFDALDSRTAGAFSIGSTVLPITFGLLSISRQSLESAALLLLGLAVVAYMVLLIFAWQASKIRAMEYRPQMRKLAENTQEYGGVAMRRWVAEEYAASTDLNSIALTRQARYVGVATDALFAEGSLIATAAIVIVW